MELDYQLYNKDCRSMKELADESIQCVVTSPPYWGLRKYSGEQELIWGGDKDCEHQWGNEIIRRDRGSIHGANAQAGNTLAGVSGIETKQGNFCSLCGAWKGAYGLEPTPEMYIEHTIEILREIRRVLRKDGVVFWNIGDSYWSTAQGTMNAPQEDGWWVRSVIIWSKPNPMPESVKDRPTESHEYILMLTKSSRYYWDADAVRERAQDWGTRDRTNYRSGTTDPMLKQHGMENINFAELGRNIRSVWEFPTQPGPSGAVRNFAVFPEKLPELCIKAATPEIGCCSKCGAPWERVLDKKPSAFNIRVRDAKAGRATPEEGYKATQDEIDSYPGNHPDPGYRQTIGWQPTCKCNAEKTQSIVLDPFAGAGTVLWVAKKLNRKAVGYEISPEYCELITDRCRQAVLSLVPNEVSR